MRLEKLQTKSYSSLTLKHSLVCLIKMSTISKDLWEMSYQCVGLILSKKGAKLNEPSGYQNLQLVHKWVGNRFEMLLLLLLIILSW